VLTLRIAEQQAAQYLTNERAIGMASPLLELEESAESDREDQIANR
jgi:hypothetical protein